MKRKAIVIGLVLIVGAAAGWWYVQRGEKGNSGVLRLYGNVDIRQVELGFRVSGRLQAMNFEEGDVVKVGDELARLDDTPYREALRIAEGEVAAQRANVKKFEAGARPAEIAQAGALVAERRATLKNTKQLLERRARLLKGGHVSQQAYDEILAQKKEAQARLRSAQDALTLAQEGFRKEDIAIARANLQVAEARLAQAQTQVADTHLKAPAGGIILSRVQQPGAIVAIGTPVYVLSLGNPVWVRSYVSEPDLGRVYPGMKVTVSTDSAPNKRYHGHIGFISPVAEFTPKTVETPDLRTDLVYRLRVIVDDADRMLRQGMPVSVDVPLEGGAAQKMPGG
ncbi:secretion protein HlyD [Varunaivibrio sulfuroxidans]|uniref:HlyD family secretion protein n=1 Tax=Varunaivibrio sulfuroxidans TaxID=1773489 RepID=A0A4R3J719_9PROT|nr:secretion protein HlyD [Varunaivibrio sulfuroxidans]TCS60673.1 HlyD family secretion protein [Varunaivibrio sulfuroxidans]WES30162.1 secretion protein HlyD [Varunaivibrio sulfuroxidans]